MKQLSTPSGNILIVKVPKFADRFKGVELVNGNFKFDLRDCFWIDTGLTIPNNWTLLSTSSKLTEEQAMELVEQCPHYCKCWKHYKPEIKYFQGLEFNKKVSCWSAIQSFYSLMASNECYLTNPYGDKPETDDYHEYMCDAYKTELKQWQKAQESTGEYLILI